MAYLYIDFEGKQDLFNLKCIYRNLEGNELSGSVPTSLVAKQQNGSLELRFTFYPNSEVFF